MPIRLKAVKNFATFATAISANLSECIITMAKARVSTNPMYTGGAGGYSFYVRDGEQVVRQRKNNSNYGESASRTQPQMERRVRWANLVNFYKAMSFWQPKAYETKAKGQTDYNVFMSLNINGSVVGLTRDMALNGCSVVENYNVSRGSLPSLQAVGNVVQNGWAWDIILSITIGSSTTVGQLSADIIDNNPDFRQGDNLAFIIFKNTKATNDFPYVSCIYSELTLDRNSDKLLQSINLMDRLVKSSQNTLGATFGASGSKEAGGVLIHTRKVEGSLQVSSQKILTTNENIIDDYSSAQWIDECIASYGLDQEVPLDPSFSKASISSVTANGSAIAQGATLTGSQTVVIEGQNLTRQSIQLRFNNTLYTPLVASDTSQTFIIGDNGSVSIMLDGKPYLSFSVGGVVVPEGLPTILQGRQKSSTDLSHSGSGSTNTVSLNDVNCINYPYRTIEEYPYFLFSIYIDEDISGDLTYHNCTVNQSALQSSSYRVNVSVTDASEPAYIEYKGFIIAVFNYTN